MKKLAILFVGLGILIIACGGGGSGGDPQSSSETSTSPKIAANELEVVFTYGSEKSKWVEAVTPAFNQAKHQTASGKVIRISPIAEGSGKLIDEVLKGERQAHIVSPASEAFIKLGNAESQVKMGKDLVSSTDQLVLSPVIIAMWEPMAKALGWGEKPIGWKEIHDLALNPDGWAALGHPEWGKFRFGHTHPDFSNSGLISLFAEVYAGAGKVRGLTLDDVANPVVGDYLEELEASIVHYGRSTGFFGQKLLSGGPGYLSAAVLYENIVVESYGSKHQLPFPVVAIYPKEGTFWSDHPAGIVNREWVTADHREAAQMYLDYLQETPQQRRALEFGFRPADVTIPISAPLDSAHGVDPEQPTTVLEVPDVPVMSAIRDLWKERKKKSNVILVLDTSGSMGEENKMENAKDGALQLLKMLGEKDHFSMIAFSTSPQMMVKKSEVGPQREQLASRISGLYADGGTALYDAVLEAHQFLEREDEPGKITAIVVLSDGEDTKSTKTTLDGLLKELEGGGEIGNVRVFTIGYGSGAKAEVLEKISDITQAKYYRGTPQNINEVFLEISTFF